MPTELDVLYEDNHLLALCKPAGLATMGKGPTEDSLFRRAQAYVKRKYDKPGNVYLGVVSRLDTPTTGVVLFARTSKAAARLSAQFRERTVEKTYWALVEGSVLAPHGEWRDGLVAQPQGHGMLCAAPGTTGAQEAHLAYQVLRQISGGTWLEVRLFTGRKHQIRVQAAARGHAVWGDRRYGSQRSFPEGIALHARQLRLKHPVRGEPIVLTAPLPKTWRNLGLAE